jgi:hypothetical protein
MKLVHTSVAVVLYGLAAAASCRGCGERIYVSRVMLSGVPESAQSRLSGEKVRNTISKDLSGSSPFRVDPGAADGWTLKIGLRGVVDALASGAVPSPGDESLQMDVKLQRHDGKTGLEAYAVTVALSAGDLGALRASAKPEDKVAALVAGGLSRIRTQMKLRGFELPDLVKELAAKEAWRRELAVEELGRRRSREAVPQLLLKLKDPEKSVAMKAVGALVAAGDTSVAAPIIEFARGKDAATQIQILYAVSQLGGPVAEGYLFVMANGHADIQIAHAAKEAFDELEGRKAKAAGQRRSAAE